MFLFDAQSKLKKKKQVWLGQIKILGYLGSWFFPKNESEICKPNEFNKQRNK